MFYQGDTSLERSQGGLGIGLTLVRRLVELHGGRVEARSEGLGHGSEFLVRLPLGADALESIPARGRDSQAFPAGHRVLIADDNRDSAESLARLLRLSGSEVGSPTTASSVAVARRHSRTSCSRHRHAQAEWLRCCSHDPHRGLG
jgi:hypothetical protein